MKSELVKLTVGFALLGIIFGVSYVIESGLLKTYASPLEKYADQVIQTCSKESYAPPCYDIEIPKLMDQGLTMEQSFEVTKIIQEKVDGYFFCHVLGHNLSAKETAKDPSMWTSVVARCPTGMCSNGCLHGAAQERFRDDVLPPEQVQALIPELGQICEPGHGRDFTGLEQASCYHSLGHLTMYITGAQIGTATKVCDAIAYKSKEDDYTQVCYEGVYMQVFQPLEPEDFALVKDIAPTTQREAQAFCDESTGDRRSACYRESWPLYIDELMTGPGIERFCSLVSNKESERRCYNGIFYMLTARFDFKEERVLEMCNGLSDKRKAQCFANSASRFMETDYRLIGKAVALCATAEKEGVGKRCYDELLFYSSFNFHKDSAELKMLCEALPEPWGTQCFTGEGASVYPGKDDF